jgi:hypothetical protein
MLRDFKKPLAWVLLCLILSGSYLVATRHRVQSQSTANSPSPSIPNCPDSAGNHLNMSGGAMSCGTSSPAAYLTGTTGSIGGGLLALGGSASGTATVTGAVAGQPCIASPSDGTNISALGMSIECTVTASNTVTVNAVAFVALTPPAKTYNVRVYP